MYKPILTQINNGSLEYKYGEEALKRIKTARAIKIEAFRSDPNFQDLANPVQLSLDR